MNKGPAGKYGVWVDQGIDPATGKPVSVDALSVKLRVLAIPQAGMGAWAFHGWQAKLPKWVEVLPVELPGRNSRMLEEKGQSLAELVAGICDALAPTTLRQKPFVVLGHSLGAWMAFEVCAELERRGGPAPVGLVVSGCRAPRLHDPDAHDVDRVAPRLARLPGGEGPGSFWAHFERRYGVNPDLSSAGIKAYVEPLLRSDFRILETYAPTSDGRLACPVHACAAVGDNRVDDAQLAAWADYGAAFSLEWFDAAAATPAWSTPHRYLVDSPDVFCASFGPLLETWLANWGPKAPLKPGAYDVASKKGALVREAAGLDSPQVGDLLPPGTRVTVAEALRFKDPSKKPRARITAPVAGWLSCSMLAKPPAAE